MSTHSIEGPRACRADELPSMIKLVDSVMRGNSKQSFLTDYPLVYQPDNLGNVQVITSGSEVVSVVPFLPKEVCYQGSRFRIGIISPTATHPDYRRLGYAHQCLQSCIALMEEAEIELSVLWTLPATFPFYEAAGFRPVPPQMKWVHCTREDAALFPRSSQYDIVPLDPGNSEHLTAIEKLYQSEESGIVRSRHDIEILFNLPTMVTQLAVHKDGDICGYIIYCTGTHKPGVLEAHGAKEAIESLLNHCLTTSPIAQIPIYLSLNPSNLSLTLHERLSSRLLPMDAGPMMIRVNHPTGFLRSIQSRIGRSLAEACQQGASASMVPMLFGSRGTISTEPAPGYFPIPMLDHS